MRALLLIALIACKGNDAPKPTPATGSAPADAAQVARPNVEARGVDLPEVARGLEPIANATLPTLVVTKTAVIVEGMSVVAIEAGRIDPSDKEGGTFGIKIPKLSHMLGKIPSAPSLQLAIDKATPYRVLVEVMFSAKQPEAGWKSFDILARRDGTLVRAPVALPDLRVADDPTKPATHPHEAPVQPVVAITKTDAFVASISGREGTIKEPKLRVSLDDPAAAEKIGEALAGIAQRNPTKEPAILMADAETPVQRVVEMLAAMRPAYPDVRFSAGFE